jgi:hypothetical protein
VAELTAPEAVQRARQVLAERIELRELTFLHGHAPYGFDPAEHYAFSFDLYEPLHVGASNLVIVSRRTGEIVSIVRFGE